MATTTLVPVSIPGGKLAKSSGMLSVNSGAHAKTQLLTVRRKDSRRNLCIRAQYNDRSSGTGADFVAGFILGGAIFGSFAYLFAPQIRRSLLNEDELGFKKAKRPIYYDEGLEKTRETLNEKIRLLSSAIDNVSSRLRGGNNLAKHKVTVETDAEEAEAAA